MRFFKSKLSSVLAAASTISAMLVGCSHNNGVETLDANKIKASQMSASEKGEALALAAEQMVFTTNFEQAHKVLQIALEMDPTNTRAKAYEALLRPVLYSKGIAKRISPLIDTLSQKDQDAYNNSLNSSYGPLKNYALNGSPDISTIPQAQQYIDGFAQQLEQSAEDFASLNSQEITLHVFTPTDSKNLGDVSSGCQTNEIKPGVFESKKCSIVVEHDYKLNSSD